RHTRFSRDWSSDVCASDLIVGNSAAFAAALFLAACVQFCGLNVSISVGAFACLLGFVVRSQFFGERNSRPAPATGEPREKTSERDRKSTRLNSSHVKISYA